MFQKISKTILITFFFLISLNNLAKSEVIKQINVSGNDRISTETIMMFSSINEGDNLDSSDLNDLLKRLYETNFFENVSLEFSDNILDLQVIENPIIQNININGIKAKKIKSAIQKNLKLKSRSSFNKNFLKKDKEKILKSLKNLGYYFPSVEIIIETLDDNKINLNYEISLGKKAKIKKITFIGDKIFKERKLKSLIISEEFRMWKFISGKKFLNENIISLDKRLLKNFYLNKGFYNVKINTSFAKLVDKTSFELIFNIEANERFYFNNLNLKLPLDFEIDNFNELFKLFEEIKGKPYSINIVKQILDKIDNISINDQYASIKASVVESFDKQQINLNFILEQDQQTRIEKINILGNNITRENVIRNQFEIDEGDTFSELLTKKSINNIKSLNFFKSVDYKVEEGSAPEFKILNITVDEKATGEISAGAGVGTGGGTVSFSVKENNYLGKGISVSNSISLNKESLKGILSITNPNYNNSDKLVYFTAEVSETDRLSLLGYKTNKSGFSLGTKFEYLQNLKIGMGNSNYYENIETDSTASAKQKLQKGNYLDSFINLQLDYDTRNQKFQTTEGLRSQYYLDLPVISETSTLSNTYSLKRYSELFENNISSISLYLKASNSLKNEDIKLSERILLPSSRLRGFERGKIGPKDGDDFIGGNYAFALNFSSTVPQLLENSENIDFLLFFDAANVWGVDYFKGDDEGSEIRSSVGIGIDWLTPIGPLKFSLSEALTKSDTDVTESFRFDLGTTF